MEEKELKERTMKVFVDIFIKGVHKPFPFGQGSTEQAIAKFLDAFQKTERSDLIPFGRVVDYLIYQCHKWREFNKWRNISLSWFFGDTAIQKFYEAKAGCAYYENLWLQSLNEDRDNLKNAFQSKQNHPMRAYIEMPSEDSTKARFLNEEHGYTLCVQSTLLYAPSSSVCKQCNFSKKCIELLKTTYPELHRFRLL